MSLSNPSNKASSDSSRSGLRTKNIMFFLVTLVVSCVVALLLIEGLLRAWYFVHNRLEPPLAYRVDDLGWRPTPNVSLKTTRKGYGEILFSSTRDGFRRYGEVETMATKVLVVGDSFTQAYHVSDGKAYYDYLANSDVPTELFVFAAGGYGTLQQTLALEQYIPEVQPDVIVWQFTGNDFINNDWFLESMSPENSSHMRRPFFEGGHVVYRHPDGFLGTLAEYSFLVRRGLVIRGSFLKRSEGSIEDQLHASHPDLQRSVTTTKALVKRVAEQYATIPILAFFAGKHYYDWEQPAFESVCKLEALQCLPEVSETVAAADEQGQQIDGGRDGHWNQTGHKIAGNTLLGVLEKLRLTSTAQ